MRLPVALVAVAGVALLLAACGDDEPPPDSAHHEAARPEVIETADGVRLEARHFPALGERLAILLHMYASDQSSWFDFATLLGERGIDALTLDFRGYGSSGGEQDPSTAADDVRAALAFARARGFERVALIGASMGGTAALVAAADERVDGVAALSAPAAMAALDAASVIAAVDSPITLIAAEGDLSGAESLRDLADRGDVGNVLIMEGRSHGTELLDAPTGHRVRAWLLAFLDGLWAR